MSEPSQFDEKPYIALLECYKTYTDKVLKPSMDKSGIIDEASFTKIKKLHGDSIATCIDALKHIDKTKIGPNFDDEMKEKINECIITPMQSFLTLASRIVNAMECVLCQNTEHTVHVFPIEIVKVLNADNEEVNQEEDEKEGKKKAKGKKSVKAKQEEKEPLYGQVCIEKFKSEAQRNYKEFKEDYSKWRFNLRDGTTAEIKNPDVYARVYCPEALIPQTVKPAKAKGPAKVNAKAKK